MPGGRPYKNLPWTQSVIADAEMMLGATRSYVLSATEQEWKKLEKNEPPSERERADAWLSHINVFQSAREVIRILYDAVGAGAILFEEELVGYGTPRRRNLVSESFVPAPNTRRARRVVALIGWSTGVSLDVKTQ
jgi:hypothetical protein